MTLDIRPVRARQKNECYAVQFKGGTEHANDICNWLNKNGIIAYYRPGMTLAATPSRTSAIVDEAIMIEQSLHGPEIAPVGSLIMLVVQDVNPNLVHVYDDLYFERNYEEITPKDMFHE